MTLTGPESQHPTLSQADTHANPSASSDQEKANTTHDTYGLHSLNAFAYYDPNTHCWKTSQGTFLSDSEPYSQTWPRSGITHNGIAYQLPPSAPTIDATVSSSLLPTPTSRDWKDGTAPRYRNGRIQTDSLGRRIGGPPNPTFVEWLMGFPEGWTDLEHSETPSSPKSQNTSDE